MKRLMLVLTILLSCMLNAGSAMAAGYPWKNHAAPYNFLFGNDIDTHQQTRLEKSGSLSGFFYIKFTGIDTSDGYPVATSIAMPRPVAPSAGSCAATRAVPPFCIT